MILFVHAANVVNVHILSLIFMSQALIIVSKIVQLNLTKMLIGNKTKGLEFKKKVLIASVLHAILLFAMVLKLESRIVEFHLFWQVIDC